MFTPEQINKNVSEQIINYFCLVTIQYLIWSSVVTRRHAM